MGLRKSKHSFFSKFYDKNIGTEIVRQNHVIYNYPVSFKYRPDGKTFFQWQKSSLINTYLSFLLRVSLRMSPG